MFFATIALTVTLYIKTPKGYFPTDDSGFVIGVTRSSPDISFQAMLGLQQQLADIVMADPAVAGIGSILGSSTTNRGLMLISLKPLAQRGGLTTALAIDQLRKKLYVVAGIRLLMFAAQDIRTGGRQSRLRLSIHAVEHRSRSPAEMGAASSASAWRRSKASPTFPLTAIPADCNCRW